MNLLADVSHLSCSKATQQKCYQGCPALAVVTATTTTAGVTSDTGGADAVAGEIGFGKTP